MVTRRLFLGAGLVSPMAAQAHDEHDLSGLEARVLSATGRDGVLSLHLELVNRRDTRVALEAAYCEIGLVEAVWPLELPVDRPVQTEMHISASGWPGIFTLILDFGAYGRGPVTVIPS